MVESGSIYKVAKEFNRNDGKNITHNTVGKLIKRFLKSGSDSEQQRSFQRHIATDESTKGTKGCTAVI